MNKRTLINISYFNKYLSRNYVRNHQLRISPPTSKEVTVTRSVDLSRKKCSNSCAREKFVLGVEGASVIFPDLVIFFLKGYSEIQ